MRPRRRSPFSRAFDTLPVVGVLGLCVAVVFIAMNVLVSAAPLAIDFSSASPSASLGSLLPGSPSVQPLPPTPEYVSPAPSASLPGFRPTIINSAIHASDPKGAWTVYLLYPTFEAGSTPWAELINADIGSEIDTRATQWEQGPAANVQQPGKVNVLAGQFKTELLTNALASFTLTWTDDSSAAPPAVGVETINLDLSTGQRIAIDDVFTDTEAAVNIMSQTALKQLKVQLGDNSNQTLLLQGASAVRTNFAHWASTAAGIKITFEPHQVEDSSTDLPTVVVPWAALRATMNRTGPTAALAGLAG